MTQLTVDLDRYPLLEPGDGPGRALVERCANALAANGACELPGFIRPATLTAMVRECDAILPSAHHSPGRTTPYLEIPGDEWPEDHPRRHWGPSITRVVAYDRIPAESLLRQLYEWDPLMDFLSAVLGLPRLFRYADPLGALNLVSMQEGDELSWHFDQTDFVVSLALRGSTTGGDFEYVPSTRTPNDERYAEVAEVLAGDASRCRRVPMQPGTLLLFQGRYSMHRVTRIGGPVSRVVALLAYDRKPGTDSTELLKRARYGRVC